MCSLIAVSRLGQSRDKNTVDFTEMYIVPIYDGS